MEFSKIYNKALLSEACYADLRDVKNPDGSYSTVKVQNTLIASGFSKTQAEEFVTHWRVVSHQANTDTGFSATVFESIDNPGELTFAMRGTEGKMFNAEGYLDWQLADIQDIGANGIALRQAVDPINHDQRLKTSRGEVLQFELYKGQTAPPKGTLNQIIDVASGDGMFGANVNTMSSAVWCTACG